MILNFEQAKKLIQEGDVLLFRSPPFPAIGWWITRYTRGLYSHVGLAHWDNDILYCVEQREFLGGRSVTLDSQTKVNPGRIDVFRAKPKVFAPKVSVGPVKPGVVYESRNLTYEVKRQIVETGLKMTGTGYGWANIWGIFKAYAPFARIVMRKPPIDDSVESKAYVCSTLVTYSYRKHYADPCPNLNDDRTTPDDISRSALFDYLFTIE